MGSLSAEEYFQKLINMYPTTNKLAAIKITGDSLNNYLIEQVEKKARLDLVEKVNGMDKVPKTFELYKEKIIWFDDQEKRREAIVAMREAQGSNKAQHMFPVGKTETILPKVHARMPSKIVMDPQ